MKGTVEGKFARTIGGIILRLNENELELGTDNPLIEKSSDKLEDLIGTSDVLLVDISPDSEGGIVVPRIAETLNDLNAYKKRFETKDWILVGVATREQVNAAMFYASDEEKEEETKK